ncbi:hypothetical protein BCR34DRAFT_606550 [Clohesyomyces aquaticus]|uniref:Uncharacterized protein n=1 Tax=Clohesyomyces aquaticus TaxID=1231657 RepID=A0A1Y1YNM1_9PLEO|nr:hypothetical protein BCR34DRAFT_606550 [Clohesyomyces aquaticus]
MQQQPARRSQPSRPLERSPGVERDPIDPSGSTTGRPVAPVNTSRITQRPVPQSQLAEPREYQLSQIRRRFAPKEHNKNSSTVLTFRLRPSDPDFPFDMEALHCSLLVPLDYPNGGPPTLKVTNPHMARGYQINVEHGFDQIVATAVSSTLLAHLNSLDKQLESLLSAPKADTIKIVSHKKAESNSHVTTEPEIPPPSLSQIRVQKTANLIIVPTAEQRSRAKEKRDVETRQLEARMGRLPQFSKSPDGLTYTIPMEPRKRNSLPVELQAIKLVKLIVAADYNLSPCRIQLVGVNGASASTMEECFLARVSKFPDMTLLNHMNHLSQNMHLMAKEEVKSPHTFSNTNTALPLTSPEPTVRGPRLDSPRPPLPTSDLPDRSQVVTIPRPPEWNPGTEEDAEISDSSSDEDSEFEGDDDNNTASEHEMSKPEGPSSPERGILVSFPHIELHGIELLEITSLSVTVKCDRCKDTKDIANLQNNNVGNHTRLESCKKCANAFTIGFRAGLMHANSSRAGYLDLDGCMVVDMLPR